MKEWKPKKRYDIRIKFTAHDRSDPLNPKQNKKTHAADDVEAPSMGQAIAGEIEKVERRIKPSTIHSVQAREHYTEDKDPYDSPF